MKTTIRRMGNSQGLTIPKPLLSQVGLAVNTPAELRVEGEALVLRKSSKLHYALDELIARCDREAPGLEDLSAWLDSPAAGREAW